MRSHDFVHRTPITTWLLVFAITLIASHAGIAKGPGRGEASVAVPDVVSNVVVVKFKDGFNVGAQNAITGLGSFDRLLAQNKVYRLEQVARDSNPDKQSHTRIAIESVYFAHYSGNASPFSVSAALRQDSAVEYAEPKYMHKLFATPNDPQYGQQSFFEVIKVAQAWDVVKGQQGGVVVAIVDGGTERDHPDLRDNFHVNAGEVANNGLDDDGNGFVDDVSGWNFGTNSNDPTGSSSTPTSANHGTHTAGIACAVTNNETGVAGASWNAELIPINAANPNSDTGIIFGFEGILYAANLGAGVISNSWGRLGPPSAFEQDVIDHVTDLGAVVVAAAGNDNTSAQHYPSAYRNVLAVANTNNSDTRNSSSNYGTWVDIAAPGTNIRSTFSNASYGPSSGTSMSCPLVAGVVALVRTQHPDWSGLQAAEQVRVTADNIDAQNPTIVGLLGKGRLNAQRAVTEQPPSIRISKVEFVDGNGDGVIQPQETVQVFLTLKNFLTSASNVSLSLNESDGFITLTTASNNLPSLGTLQEIRLSTPFQFSVANNAPSGHPVEFTLNLTAGSYSDRDHFVLTVLPTFGNLSVNNIATTVTNVGRIGFGDPSSSANGVGFRFKGGPSLLWEGSLIMGTGPGKISNAARGLILGNSQDLDEDFTIAPGGDLRITTPGAISDQESIGIFTDAAATSPMNIRVTQESFSMNASPNDDLILLRYTFENLSQQTLSNFHFGIFFDWDIDQYNFDTNSAAYDAARRLGYAFDTGDGPDTYVGCSLVSNGGISCRAIYNDPDDPDNPGWGLHDGFTDTEKWEAISGGATVTTATTADVSFVIGTGPYTILPNGSVQVGFSLLAGENLADLQTNAEAAKALWDQLLVTSVQTRSDAAVPLHFSLEQNYPNPFNPVTTIEFAIAEATEVSLLVFDLDGREITSLVRERLQPGVYRRNFDAGNLAAGVYFYRLETETFTSTRKLVLVK